MSTRHSNRVTAAARPRRRRGASMAVAVAAIAGAVVVTLTTMARPTPSPVEAAPAADVPASTKFLPTVENATRPQTTAPEGMVWIPGGEFSMGAPDMHDLHDAVGMQATTDSRPVHRVF